MLVGDLIFFEELRHFFRHYISIILNGDERDFFSRLGLFVRRGLVRLFGLVSHKLSIHQQRLGLWIYSKASSDDFSGNCRLQFWQVTK